MKRSSLFQAVTFLFAAPVFLLAQSTVKEDDFLFFDKIEEEAQATPVAPAPPPADSAVTSARPLPAVTTASLRTILLDVPDKSFATGRLSKLTATASQRGNQAQPVVEFPGATISLRSSIDKAAAALVAANQETGGSVLELAGAEYMVRASGYLKTLDDFRAVPLVARGGVPVRLGDELQTLAHDNFGGSLRGSFSAHPHRHPATGELHAICYEATDPDRIRHVVVGTDIDGGDMLLWSHDMLEGGAKFIGERTMRHQNHANHAESPVADSGRVHGTIWQSLVVSAA